MVLNTGHSHSHTENNDGAVRAQAFPLQGALAPTGMWCYLNTEFKNNERLSTQDQHGVCK